MIESIWNDIERVMARPLEPPLTPDDYSAVVQLVWSMEAATHAKHSKLRESAARQGVKHAESLDALRADFWPEDDSVDEFLEWIDSVRHANDAPRLPE